MATVAQMDTRPAGSTQFIITLDRTEKARWRAAAEDAGVSIAEYVRRAVQQSAEAPTAAEIAEARALAAEVNAAAGRMEAMLDRTLAQIAEMVDADAEAERRTQILRELDARGERLDLGLLARA